MIGTKPLQVQIEAAISDESGLSLARLWPDRYVDSNFTDTGMSSVDAYDPGALNKVEANGE